MVEEPDEPPTEPRNPPPTPARDGEADEPPAPVSEPSGPASAPAVVPEPIETWETRFKYLLADFENFRRRVDRERSHIAREGQARLLRGILPLYEAAQKAREVVQNLPARDPIRQGIELLNREWEKFLRAERVTTVARPGVPYRSETMEAVAEAPANTAHPSGSVLEVVQQGYLFEDDLLRAAKVVVARARTTPATEAVPTVTGPPDDPTVG